MKQRHPSRHSLLFVDTWGWCASANQREREHQQVQEIMETLLETNRRLLTTNFVLDETYTLVRFRVYHQAAIDLHEKVGRLAEGRLLRVISVTPEIELAAWNVFKRYSDKDFSFIDCVSFAVMQALEVNQALTDDHHFEQMGFQILP